MPWPAIDLLTVLVAVFPLLCSWSLQGCNTTGDWSEPLKFSCPPNPKYNEYHEAYRAPVGRNHLFVPVLASKRPGSPASSAVIIIHGALRETGEMYQSMKKVVGCEQWGSCQHKDITTLIVTFGLPPKKCTGKEWNAGPRSVHVPVWSKGDQWYRATRWVDGGFDDKHEITSFEALDVVIRWVESRYPTLERIVVTGFSAGGQFLQRWSVISKLGVGGKSHNGAIQLRSLVISASSLVYLDHNRPDINCTPDRDTGPEHTCKSFWRATSNSSLRTFDEHGRAVAGAPKSCGHGSDLWPWGLADVLVDPDRLEDEPCGKFGNNCVGPDVRDYLLERRGNVSLGFVRRHWRSKDVRFMVGDQDVLSCNVGKCSNLCSAIITGTSRLQRNLNYMDYLRLVLPGYAPVFGTFEGGHDVELAWNSDLFRCWALENTSNLTCDDMADAENIKEPQGEALATDDSDNALLPSSDDVALDDGSLTLAAGNDDDGLLPFNDIQMLEDDTPPLDHQETAGIGDEYPGRFSMITLAASVSILMLMAPVVARLSARRLSSGLQQRQSDFSHLENALLS